MGKLGIHLIPLLLLALMTSAVGCGDEYITPTPRSTPTVTSSPTERQEIIDFLNDSHVNAVLWEEWNIFDEWVYVRSLYESSPQSGADFNRLWQQEKALANRARQNYQALLGVNPPQPLQAFYEGISAWVKQFDEWFSIRGPLEDWLLQRAYQKHAEAWLELRRICREHDIKMEWPLPAIPS